MTMTTQHATDETQAHEPAPSETATWREPMTATRSTLIDPEPSEAMMVPKAVRSELDGERLLRAKHAYTARHFFAAASERRGEGYSLVQGDEVRPQTGDLVLARVVEVGHHKRIESHDSYRRHLFVGDEIVVAYGHRYAPDQFLAEVPRNLDVTNLVAAGGVAADVREKHNDAREATRIEPIGLIAGERGVLGLADTVPHRVRDWTAARDDLRAATREPRVVLVFGSSMNSGKSTSVGCLVNGLTASGLSVAAGKATGTGAGNDSNMFRDAGARDVLDFTDFGLASTYLTSFERIKDLVFSMITALAESSPDVVVVEIADGIYQGETAALIDDADLGEVVDSVVFACGEALSAAAGSATLLQAGLPLAAVTGTLTSSPLVAGEASRVSLAPVVSTFDLCLPEVARRVLGA